jgi:hypothetical protein
MWIMNVVWPVTALFGTLPWLWAYFRYGRLAPRHRMHSGRKAGYKPYRSDKAPLFISVGKATSHCGAGCALGDICAEWLAFAVPTITVWLGWPLIFKEKLFAVWILDFIFAYVFGVAFQYFTIVPMQGLNFRRGIWAAIKADTLSLIAWQLGMYGFMAIAYFWIFRDTLGTQLKVNTPEFWFMMQIAMLCGFGTSYPLNRWLLRVGLKERM